MPRPLSPTLRSLSLSLLLALPSVACTSSSEAPAEGASTGVGAADPASGVGGSAVGGGGSGQGTGSGGSSATGSNSASNGGAGGGLTLATSGGGAPTDCDAEAQLVYVLSTESDIYRFRPDVGTFDKVSTLSCNAPGMHPNSMAIDRDAKAWVNYVDASSNGGRLYKVDLSTGACDAQSSIALPEAWSHGVGMGFSSDVAGSSEETLFLATDGPGLAKVDLATGQVTEVGSFTDGLAHDPAELTGTGDARLFGFFPVDATQGFVAEIDKASGHTPVSVPVELSGYVAWYAFSFWGGDFYVYTSDVLLKKDEFGDVVFDEMTGRPVVEGYSPSRVIRLPRDGGSASTFLASVGFTIVGAGVSTCAPVDGPR